MTVISTTKDRDTLTLTLVAECEASPDRVWEVWEDPRQLERWWGPPTFPATFTRHDFIVGGESRYFMNGPARDTPRPATPRAAGGGSRRPPDRAASTSRMGSPATTASRRPASSRRPSTSP